MYNGNVQQNPLFVEPCVTEKFSISPRFSPMIFDPHANSVLLQGPLLIPMQVQCSYEHTFVQQNSY